MHTTWQKTGKLVTKTKKVTQYANSSTSLEFPVREQNGNAKI